MPRKSRSVRRVRKGKARRQTSKNKVSIVRFPKPNGIPDRVRMRLVYSDLAKSLATTAGVGPGYAYYRVAFNDLTDPDTSGIGAQPPVFDNMRALYKRWRVNSCKIVANVENFTNFPTYVTAVAVYDPTTNTPTSPANPNTYDLMALPADLRSSRVRLATVQTGDANSAVLKKTFYPNRIFGENYFSSVNFAGGATAPTAQGFIDIIAQTGAPGTAVPNIGIWLSFRLEWDVTFFIDDVIENAAYD